MLRVAKIRSILIVLLMTLSGMTMLVPAAAAPMDVLATTDRTVLVELFTGADCPPCVNADHGLDDFIADHTRKEAVALVYHRDIPRPDKLETTECVQRQAWYVSSGGHSTPNEWVDGKIVRVGGFNSRAAGEQWFENGYNTRRAIKSEFKMNVSGSITPGLTGKVWVNVTALGAPTLSNLYLHTVIARETYGPWNGGNGVLMHYNSVRKMLPGVNGEAISISSGQTISKSYTFDLSGDHSGSDWWTVDDDMVVVAFVQTHTRSNAGSNRYAADVLQATHAKFNAVPNKAPWIRDGQLLAPPGATEDDEVTFKTFYWDVDNVGDDPIAKVFYKNKTSAVMEHDLVKVPSGVPWTQGKWVQWKTTLDPGTYTYRFYANDSEADALGDTAWNATEVTILPRNKVPQLSTQSYAPLEGDTTTTFRFDVMYRDLDNDAPAEATLNLNDVAYTMLTDETTIFNDWATYYYETALPVGDNHRYYFTFSDGKDSTRLPAVDASPNWIRGPTVVKPNHAPTLTTALFNPDSGTRMDDFMFTIIYTDGESDHPTISYIYIDEVANIMTPDGFDYTNGQVFRFRTSLGIGEHNIRFLFNDGKHEVRYPPTLTIPGPTVINMDPVGGIAAPTDLKRYTPDDFIPFSAIGSEDPESDPLQFKWTSSIEGVLGTQEAFDKQLVEGEHVITLEVTDEYGGLNTVSVSITVKALMPEPYVVGHVSSVDNPVEKDMIRYTITIDNKGETSAQGITVRFIVDGTQVKTDIVSVSVGNPVEVRFNWEAELGMHDLRIEVPGDSYDFTENVDSNSPPAVTTTISNEGGKDVKYKVGEEIFFGSTATDENGDDITYVWDFGDGTTSTNAVAGHIYSEKGTYTVTMTATDSRGDSNTDIFTVEITKAKTEGDESPGFGAFVAIAAFMATIVAVSRRRK
jgi:hypothetical protein